MKYQDASINMLVTHPRYGGFARILSLDEDGVSPNGQAKYVATVKFGPNNSIRGRAKYTDVYELPLGQLEPATSKPAPINPIENMTPTEILAAIAELDKQLQGA